MAFLLQMREMDQSSLNVQYKRQIIVVKVSVNAFASSLLESVVLALIS
jgi:hypothetical protein